MLSESWGCFGWAFGPEGAGLCASPLGKDLGIHSSSESLSYFGAGLWAFFAGALGLGFFIRDPILNSLNAPWSPPKLGPLILER